MTQTPQKASEWQPTLDDTLVQAYILDRAGEQGVEIARLIEKQQPVQGVEILETVQDKPSNVRKTLYKLEDARVAEYQKDTDKTGWETFIWRLTLNEVKHQINKERHKMLQSLRDSVALEKENSFYICSDDHERTIFEDAMRAEFKCPQCGKSMDAIDNEQRVGELEKAIKDLELLVFD